MPGNDLVFFGTTGSAGISDGSPSTPSPADWLGKFRAPETLHELQSTITSAQDARALYYITDTARIGDGAQAHQLKWIAMLTGPTAPSAARVMSFDTATGIFKLDRRLAGGPAASGDDYAIFDRNNVWPDVTATQARAGEERFRCIYFRNQHGSAITNVRIYFRVLEVGGTDFARLHQNNEVAAAFIERSDDTTDILDTLGQRVVGGGSDNFSGSGGWRMPFIYAASDTNDATLGNNAGLAVWLRRSIPKGLRFRTSVAIQIIAESDVSGSDPDPLLGSAIMAYDINGETITGSLQADRYLHIGGGTRITGTILGDSVALASKPAKWGIKTGDPGSIATDDDPVTSYDTSDTSGQVFATYASPTTPGLAGTTTTIELTIGSGTEVGDP